MKTSPPIAIVFGRTFRTSGILDDRGRKGGGLELFLGGYAKCIVKNCLGDVWDLLGCIRGSSRLCLVSLAAVGSTVRGSFAAGGGKRFLVFDCVQSIVFRM